VLVNAVTRAHKTEPILDPRSRKWDSARELWRQAVSWGKNEKVNSIRIMGEALFEMEIRAVVSCR